MTIQNVKLELIDDNPYQPRTHYSTNKIEEIAYSIKEIGLRQTPEARPADGRFQLAYGHLRKRSIAKLVREKPKDACTEAAGMIKQGAMPLDVKDISDHLMLLYGIEENLRRDDITPLDLARSAEIYCTKLGKSETELAKKLNMTQGNVSNMRRVLRLPQKVLQYIEEGKINFTMARELLIFQGLKAEGFEREWSRKEGEMVSKPKDEEYLMAEAIRGIGGQYGPAATVDGIKKSIFNVAERNFKWLEHMTQSWAGTDKNPLFDTRAAGCLQCPKMIRCWETKSQSRHFCTDTKCWEKKQEAHKKQQSAEAKKKMEEDIARRVAADERERQERQPISQEIAQEPDIVDYIPEEEREGARKAIDHFKNDPRKILCRTCLNVGHCDRTSMYAVSGVGADEVLACDNYMGAEDAKKVREKAIIKIPPELKELAKEKAGTRAEVLDLRELRCGCYGDLKTGYVLLNGGFRENTLDIMVEPEECTERCTKGFHYAFDSEPRRGYGEEKEPGVYSVCTNPKCVAQKKAAFTRAKNAAGQAKKKAELEAIKKSIAETERLDHARMKLIILAMIDRDRSYYYSSDREVAKFFLEKFNVQPVKEGYSIDAGKTKEALFAAIDKAPEGKLAKVIVELMLHQLTYQGDIKEYKILTTQPLNWMGIGMQVPK